MYQSLRTYSGSVLCLIGVLVAACTPIRPASKGQGVAEQQMPMLTETDQAATPCPIAGERKCTGPDGHGRLECQGGKWVQLPACEQNESCSGAGECRAMGASPCAVGGAGTEYCEGEDRRVCLDGKSSTVVPCGANRRCRDLGTIECGCVPGAVDKGDGCTLATDCEVDMGGCDAATSCTVEAGERVCGPCPSGYAGNGETGCKPYLLGLELSCALGSLALQPELLDYRVDVSLLCQQLTLQPQAAVGTSIKIKGVPLAADGSWTSELLKLGDNLLELSLASESGIDTTYKITIVRSGAQTSYIKASNAGSEDRFGFRMALSGNTMVVAAPWEDGSGAGVNPPDNNALSGSGAAYVFARQGDSWIQQAYLKADNPTVGAYFGTSVSIDGDTVAVGAANTEPLFLSNASSAGSGNVYVYTRTGSEWSFVKRVQASDGSAGDLFGWCVYLDREALLVAAPFESTGGEGSGAIYRYDRTTWQELDKVKVKVPRMETGLGTGMTVDGDTLVVGAMSDSSDIMWGGSAYVFARRDGTWVEEQRLSAMIPHDSGAFGESIAVFGDTIAVSEPNVYSSLSPPAGQVHLYERSGASWILKNTLFAPVSRGADFFGSSLTLTESYIAVGASGDPSGGRGLQGDMNDNSQPMSGALFLFARHGGAYELSTFIKPFNTNEYDAFGADANIAGEVLVIGAAFESSGGTGIDSAPNGSSSNSGAVYVFQ
jgi:trimeric autotransporter adhesin